VDAATFTHLEEARWRLGDRLLWFVAEQPFTGDDVLGLQTRLLEFGFAVGRVDGVFRQNTDECLREFQRDLGLPGDGICGPATFTALRRLSRPRVTGGRPDALRDIELLHRAGPALAGKVVVLDPGHGGADPGNRGWGLVESDLTLDLAVLIAGKLKAVGVTAYRTRGELASDEVLDDVSRARFANETTADLVVSLHADAHPDPHAEGVATFYYGSPTRGSVSTTGERFAGIVQRELVARTRLRDNHTHAKTWDLLRYTRMPAIRIEAGYLSSPQDSHYLSTELGRETVAEAVVVAVQRVYLPADADAPTGMMRLSELAG
jgi:N-acetylmuramoyl-L-alanine amidase